MHLQWFGGTYKGKNRTQLMSLAVVHYIQFCTTEVMVLGVCPRQISTNRISKSSLMNLFKFVKHLLVGLIGFLILPVGQGSTLYFKSETLAIVEIWQAVVTLGNRGFSVQKPLHEVPNKWAQHSTGSSGPHPLKDAVPQIQIPSLPRQPPFPTYKFKPWLLTCKEATIAQSLQFEKYWARSMSLFKSWFCNCICLRLCKNIFY